MKLLRNAAEKELVKRRNRVLLLREYKTFEELHEAYGYDLISDEEFREAAEALEKGDSYIDTALSHTEVAANMLSAFVGGLEAEIRYFEFELLPKEEQERIRRERDERLSRRRGQRDEN